MANTAQQKNPLVPLASNSPLDFRKKITSQFHLQQIHLLADQWGVSAYDAIWRLVTDGIMNEKRKREENNA